MHKRTLNIFKIEYRDKILNKWKENPLKIDLRWSVHERKLPFVTTYSLHPTIKQGTKQFCVNRELLKTNPALSQRYRGKHQYFKEKNIERDNLRTKEST
jgi:hypothetical protein